jgi:hypothetical protein
LVLILYQSTFFCPLFIVVLGGGTLWHLWRFLQCIKYITLEFTPSTIFLYPFPPIPGILSTGIFVAFTYFCTQLHHIYSPNPFPHHLPLSLVSPNTARPFPPSYSQILKKKREKKTWHFCLFEIKVATQGISLCYFHVYMCYISNWFISSNFLHSIFKKCTFFFW